MLNFQQKMHRSFAVRFGII